MKKVKDQIITMLLEHSRIIHSVISDMGVYYTNWAEDFEKILSRKKDGTALIVYAPLELGKISGEHLSLINEKRNATVTNFRGRLLNDLVISMITTGFD